MSAKVKELNRSTVSSERFKEVKKVASKLIEAIAVNKKLYPFILQTKKQIGAECTDIFFEDLENGEINGNHEFNTLKGSLTVNFRLLDGAEVTEYRKTLITCLPDHYEDLFDEEDSTEITASQRTMKEQFKQSPGLFQFKVKDNVSDKQLEKLYKFMPDAFELEVRPDSIQRYAATHPKSVSVYKKVYCKNGFIEKLGRIEGDLRKRMLTTLKKFFEKNISTAVRSS